MKKNIVCGALFNLICIPVYAIQTSDSTSEEKPTNARSYIGIQKTETTHPNKFVTTTKVPQSIEINCEYRIPGETQKIDKTLITNWAEYAVLHSFNYDYLSFDTQLKDLRACYTENGWIGFMNALKNSGNINLIKNQNLRVSSILDGAIQLIDANEHQWKITVPIKVFYKNDKEEITHFLNVYILISWRNAFKLGIVQMITTPRFAPLLLKESAIKEALKSISLCVNDQINSTENISKSITSFISSFFIATKKSFAKTDKILSHPELCLKLEYDITRQLQHVIEEQKNQALLYEETIKIVTAYLTSLYYKNEIENHLNLNWSGWAKNQILNIKSDIFDTKLPQLLSNFIDKSKVEFYSALSKADKIKMFISQNSVTQQRDNKPQFIKYKNNQWNISLPMNVAHKKTENQSLLINVAHKKTENQSLPINVVHKKTENQSLPMNVVHKKTENQITQLLNVNLTLGKKKNGELVILQIKPEPPSSSNRSETLISNRNTRSNSANPSQKIPQNNKIQLVHNKEMPQPSQIPKISFNRSTQSKRQEVINCDYKIPSDITKIDEDLVIRWAEHAATQSFDFNAMSIETQLQKLKSCYTAQGWDNFQSALNKSGNIEAIKSQNFDMSSKVNGQIKLTGTSKNQWNIELTLQVVYQNKQVKVTQYLDVQLTMKRKFTDDFGIMQINANLNDSVNSNSVIEYQAPEAQSNEHALQNPQQYIVEQQKNKDFIDCNYKIPIEIKNINQALVFAWAKHAVTKSFNFDSKFIDTQLKTLQSCYTDEGWNKFITALEKSGNIKTFKLQKLIATSQIDGEPQLIESKDSQWILTLPLKINYQFERNHVVQLLKIDLTVGRKKTGDLGIIRLNSSLRSNSSTPEA